MFRKCEVCSTEDKEKLFSQQLKGDILRKNPKYEEMDVQFREWSQGARELLVKTTLPIDDFVEHVTGKLTTFLRHHYTTECQSRSWKKMKSELDENTAMIHCDFAENYSCKYNMEVQKVYKFRPQSIPSWHPSKTKTEKLKVSHM